MTKTTAELRESVAKKLGVMSVDEELDAEDAAFIDARIEGATDFLQEVGLVWWVAGSIPNAALEPMTFIVASLAAPDFGVTPDPNWARDGQAMLTTIRPSNTASVMRTDPF